MHRTGGSWGGQGGGRIGVHGGGRAERVFVMQMGTTDDDHPRRARTGPEKKKKVQPEHVKLMISFANKMKQTSDAFCGKQRRRVGNQIQEQRSSVQN